jgi:hypothetical protein
MANKKNVQSMTPEEIQVLPDGVSTIPLNI